MKILGEYYNLYLQSDTLLLADVFENFWNMCLEIQELKLAHVFNYIRISMAASPKKKQSKIRSMN